MIKYGKIKDLNSNNRGWFLGKFIENPEFNTQKSKEFEAKWSDQKKGTIFPFKKELVNNPSCKSMAILVRGKFKYRFLAESSGFDEQTLENEGDYVYWSPDINHSTEALEDSLILTIRWYE